MSIPPTATSDAATATATPLPTDTSTPRPSDTPTATLAAATATGATASPTTRLATATQAVATATRANTATSAPLTPTPTPRPTATATTIPTATTAPPPPRAPSPNAAGAFLGYYVPYDPSSWLTLQAQAANLDYVALQVATFDYCGGISSREDGTLKDFARSRGLPVLASVFTSSEPLNHAVLTNRASTANAVQQVVRYVVEEGYAGVDLDLEAVPAGDRQALTAFVAQVSAALRQNGKLVVMALPAKARDATTGWAGAYDYAALAPHLDLAVIMSYGYTIATSASPGSTAPISWVEQVAAFATSQLSPGKVLLGVGLWGYDWNTSGGGRATTLRYPQAAAVAAAYGATITLDPATRSSRFTYTAKAGDPLPYQTSLPPINHTLVYRQPAACPLGPPPPLPTATVPRTPVPSPTTVAPTQQSHTVWLEDAAAVAAKLEVAARYGTGAAGWRLGQEDPATWPVIAAWRR